MKNLVRLALTSIFIVAFTISSAIVGAAVQIFDGKGEWHTSDAENQQIAMARASQRARIDAQKKAGVYLKTFSRSVNLELVDDEISAVTNNIIEIVGDVHFDKKIIQLSNNQTTILYTATLKAKIDTEGVYDWVKRDEKDKVIILRQNNDLQDAIQKNDKLSASLIEQYNRATSQAEKDRLRKQMEQTDRDFLANQKFEEGNSLHYAKNYNGAIKCYNEALKLKPNWNWAYNNRGMCYDSLKNYELAIQDYTKAIEINPKDENAYNNRGITYRNLNQYEKAIQDYNKALELDSNLSYVYNNRGVAYDSQRNHEQAIQDFNKAIELDPNSALAYNNRGIAYDQLGQHEQAIQNFNKAIEINPNLASAYSNRGFVYMNGFKQYERAIQDFNKAIEIDPNYFDAYLNRGNAYAKGLNQYEKAIESYTKAIEINPNDEDAYNNRGITYYMLKSFQQAIKDFRKALEINPNLSTAKKGLELCSKAIGR